MLFKGQHDTCLLLQSPRGDVGGTRVKLLRFCTTEQLHIYIYMPYAICQWAVGIFLSLSHTCWSLTHFSSWTRTRRQQLRNVGNTVTKFINNNNNIFKSLHFLRCPNEKGLRFFLWRESGDISWLLFVRLPSWVQLNAASVDSPHIQLHRLSSQSFCCGPNHLSLRKELVFLCFRRNDAEVWDFSQRALTPSCRAHIHTLARSCNGPAKQECKKEKHETAVFCYHKLCTSRL